MGSKRWLVLVLLAGGIGSGLICSAGRPVVVAQQAPKTRTIQELRSRFSALQSSGASSKELSPDLERADIAGNVAKTNSNVSWPIAQLIYTSVAAGAAGDTIDSDHVSVLPKPLRDLVTAKIMRLDQDGRVQVFVKPSLVMADANDALVLLGATVQRVDEKSRIIQAWVPVSALIKLASIASIGNVQLPDYGFVQAGSVSTEGDSLLKADDLRSGFGADGTGVRVGVISDGVEGLAASQASGDLPSVNTSTCDRGSGTATQAGAGGEGTAMLEIVHDLAPGAELWFGYWGLQSDGTYLDFNDAVNCLADNVDVVVDDIGFYNVGPYDGTGAVSSNTASALSDQTNRVRGYYTAVGNDALGHYQELFVNSGYAFTLFPSAGPIHGFTATSSTTDAGWSLPCAQASPFYCADTLLIAPGGVAIFDLEWNDVFGASGNDYDMFIAVDGGSPVPASVGEQNGDDDPVEEFAWINDTLSVQLLDVSVTRFEGLARTLDMFVFCPGCAPLPDLDPSEPIHNFNTRCNAISNNADAKGGVVALGAIDAADPGVNDVEPYSSCGPTNDARTKPDAVAVDGVSVTGAGGFGSPFYGTSAAGPHAAGIAALLLDCSPGLTRDQLRNAMLNTAVDLGTVGIDNVFGHGRLDALAAANSIGCAGGGTPTPTSTASPSATRTPTPTNTPLPPANTPTDTPVPPTNTSTTAPPQTSTPTVPVAATNTPTLVVPTDTPTFPNTPTFTPTFTRTPTRTPTPHGENGDATCNGTVGSPDAAVILQLDAGIIHSVGCPENADVNHDGHVNPLDASLILQFDAGLIHSLPA